MDPLWPLLKAWDQTCRKRGSCTGTKVSTVPLDLNDPMTPNAMTLTTHSQGVGYDDDSFNGPGAARPVSFFFETHFI
jgi:hypothetical protein